MPSPTQHISTESWWRQPTHASQPLLFQDLTESEQACVSRKISKLRGEGVEEDEAIARAIKECAPGKATSKATVDQEADIPRYRAAQATDGTFTIFDVPVFAAHTEEREDGREIDFGTSWLNGALATAQRRQAEGYMAPLHVSHHGEGNVEAAGKFRMTRVGPILHDGQEVDALFADLVGVRPEIFQRIMRGELSYRSVEILDVNRQEIDSLALLDDEVPFFRFPLLRVAVDRTPHSSIGGDAQVTRSSGSPALCYQARGAGTVVAFKFMEKKMPEPTTGQAVATDPTKKNASAEQLLMQIFSLIQQAMGPQGQQPEPNGQQPGVPPQQPVAPMAAHPTGQPPQGPGPVEQRPPFPVQRATPIGGVMGQLAVAIGEASHGVVPAQGADSTLKAEGAVDGLVARMKAMGRTSTPRRSKITGPATRPCTGRARSAAKPPTRPR